MRESPIQRIAVLTIQPAENRVLPLFDRALEEQAAEYGGDHQSEEESSDQREGNRPGHWTEEAAFHALQREDGQIGDDDDDARKEYRLLHFVRGDADGFEQAGAPPGEFHVAQNVLH